MADKNKDLSELGRKMRSDDPEERKEAAREMGRIGGRKSQKRFLSEKQPQGE